MLVEVGKLLLRERIGVPKIPQNRKSRKNPILGFLSLFFGSSLFSGRDMFLDLFFLYVGSETYFLAGRRDCNARGDFHSHSPYGHPTNLANCVGGTRS